MRALAASFFLHGKIRTTEAKAKALRPYAERLVTRARRAAPADRRGLAAVMPRAAAARAIADAARAPARSGGYTRMTKIGVRKSDASPMMMLEWAHDSFS